MYKEYILQNKCIISACKNPQVINLYISPCLIKYLFNAKFVYTSYTFDFVNIVEIIYTKMLIIIKTFVTIIFLGENTFS